MVVRNVLRVVLALSCLFAVADVFAGQRPSLADCCSSHCYAWNKRPDLRAVCTRDPKTWDDDARRHGYVVGNDPEAGAIAVFEAGVQGADRGRFCREAGGTDACSGHVAYVEEVLDSIRFVVSEKGWLPNSNACDVQTRVAYAGQGVTFIHQPEQAREEPWEGTAPDDGYDNGTPVIQGAYPEHSDQRWRLVPEDDYVKIVDQHSGKCLGISGGSHTNGAEVILSDCHGGDHQLWRPMSVGDHVRIMAKHSGKCLDVSRASLEEGASIIQWSYYGGGNQLWKLVSHGDDYVIEAAHSGRTIEVRQQAWPTPQPRPNHDQHWDLVAEGPYYRIEAEHSGKCLDVSRAMQWDGARVALWYCNGGDNQLWSFVPQGDGDYFKIVAKHSGKCLDVSGAASANDAPIIQWTCNGGDNQLWKLVPDEVGFKLVAKHSGKCLTISDRSHDDSTAVVQWQYSGEGS